MKYNEDSPELFNLFKKTILREIENLPGFMTCRYKLNIIYAGNC